MSVLLLFLSLSVFPFYLFNLSYVELPVLLQFCFLSLFSLYFNPVGWLFYCSFLIRVDDISLLRLATFSVSNRSRYIIIWE